jgi:hypothetical protein
MDDSLEDRMKRLANYVETQVAGIIPQLMAESRTESAMFILDSTSYLLRWLRDAANVSRQLPSPTPPET